ncbi:MAG: DUF1385 domain-containing protein [Actinobacteria bacterium]|nr:DUF1385 domain-containing protein [Actinomycetota bacterium]
MAEGTTRAQHYYGGQAVIEGVMMRGRDHWAVAVRQPEGAIHLESHRIRSVADRAPFLKAPGLRGILALGQALSIGIRALQIAAHRSSPEDERPTRGQMAVSMTIAMVFFVGIFIVLPAAGFGALRGRIGSGLLLNVLEGLFRVMLFLGYLALIGLMKDIRRVFQYHGAEHKTIAAYEHGDELVPERIDRYSTLHVRCGTNFLLLVMVLTIFVFSFFGNPTIGWRIGSRVIAIPIIAGLAYELLRLGAKYQGSLVMRIVMAPGLWLQRITTRPPTVDMIEVALASFGEVLRREREPEPAEPEPAEPEPLT